MPNYLTTYQLSYVISDSLICNTTSLKIWFLFYIWKYYFYSACMNLEIPYYYILLEEKFYKEMTIQSSIL